MLSGLPIIEDSSRAGFTTNDSGRKRDERELASSNELSTNIPAEIPNGGSSGNSKGSKSVKTNRRIRVSRKLVLHVPPKSLNVRL